MLTLTEYLKQTEFAMMQLFDSLKYYRKKLEEAHQALPSFEYCGRDDEEHIKKLEKDFFEEHKEQNKLANKMLDEVIGLKDSQSIICGSILQTAHMGISKFSNYNGECFVLTKKQKKFGIGRKINNVPLGLIIYAGRNQYNHWDDKEPYEQTRKLFDLIATSNNELDYKDPCFNIELDTIEIYSHNIIGLIGWKCYEDYKQDMIEMLSEFEEK